MPHASLKPEQLPNQAVDLFPDIQLYVNDGPLAPSQIAPLRQSDPELPLEELHRRLKEDGYLFLKHLLPREVALKAREQYFKFVSPCGLLKPDTTYVEGIFDPAKSVDDFPGIGAGAAGGNGRPGGEQAAAFVDLALDAHYQDWYTEEFCKHPALYDFIAKLTGWGEDTASFKRTLLRNNIPNAKPIGVHYDQIFLRHGEDTSITAWCPMGDVAIDGGGLIYLENGYSVGQEIEQEFTAQAKASGLTDDQTKSAFNTNMMSTGLISENPAEFAAAHNRRWLVSAYEAGDVVLHNPYAIHASTVNRDRDNVIRLATDLRFVNSKRPWDKRWSNYYTFNDGV